MHNHILSGAFPPEQEFDDAIRAYKDAGMRVLFCPGVRNDNPFVYGDNKNFFASLPQHVQAVLSSLPLLARRVTSTRYEHFMQSTMGPYAMLASDR